MRANRLVCAVVLLAALLCGAASADNYGTITEASVDGLQASHLSTTGALSLSVGSQGSSRAIEIYEVRVHLNAAGAQQTLTLTIDSGLGAAHDVVLSQQNMTSVTDFAWRPDAPCLIGRDDVLDIDWLNGGGKTVGVTVLWRWR